jgi:hypothetical protein
VSFPALWADSQRPGAKVNIANRPPGIGECHTQEKFKEVDVSRQNDELMKTVLEDDRLNNARLNDLVEASIEVRHFSPVIIKFIGKIRY